MRRIFALLVSAFVFADARESVAQSIRGSVFDGNGRPVSGVVVVLVDSTARETSRALTSDRGEFRLVGLREGRYRLRTMRIGYRSLATPIFVLGREELERRLVVNDIVFALDTVRATGRNACRVVSGDSTSAIFAVWEQVRSALIATDVTLGGRTILATTLGYDQMLDVMQGRVREQTSDIRSDFLRQPWRSLSPDSVRRAGYVVTEPGDFRTYHAPGIGVLLSDEFLGDHCLRIASGSDDRRLGIDFEPTPDRKNIPEIRGTVWVDRASAELRTMHYRYVNISRDEERHASGDMSFVRMRNGMWAISRWAIRMPTIVLAPVYRGLREVAREQRVDSIKVSGGELIAAVAPGGSRRDTLWSRPPLVLGGVVLDSVSAQPVSGAIVSIMASNQTDTTDREGRFALRSMLPGRYLLDVRTPSLDSVRMVNQTPVFFSDSSVTFRVRVPTARQIASGICGDAQLLANAPRNGIIVGTVGSTGDSSAAGARVVARWSEITSHVENAGGVQRPVFFTTRHVNDAAVDSTGTYRLCGIPLNTELTVQAMTDSSISSYVRLRIPAAQRFTRIDLALDQKIVASRAFIGVVRDSAQALLADAEVSLPEIGLSARTDARGAFRIAGMIPGEHRVVVRRVGYGPLETSIDFTLDSVVDRNIVLPHAITTLDPVVTRETELFWKEAPLLREFEDNRKLGLGKFYTRADLEKARGQHIVSLFETSGFTVVTDKMSPARWIAESRGKRSISSVASELEDRIGPVFPANAPFYCFPLVFLDFQPLSTGKNVPNINRFRADQLEAVEFYRGGAETPQRYSVLNSHCGVIVLHSRRPPGKKDR